MISQLTLDTYRNAFTTITRDNKTEVTILRDDLDTTIMDLILGRIQDLSGRSSLDLAYNIMRDATALLPSTLDALATFDAYEQIPDVSSVYTYDRLQYLTINNQADISTLARDTDQDIADACATWYDLTVQNSLADLVDYFNHNS